MVLEDKVYQCAPAAEILIHAREIVPEYQASPGS